MNAKMSLLYFLDEKITNGRLEWEEKKFLRGVIHCCMFLSYPYSENLLSLRYHRIESEFHISDICHCLTSCVWPQDPQI